MDPQRPKAEPDETDAATRSVKGKTAEQASEYIVVGRASPAAEPDRIGPYKLLEQLGQGGFGVVYLAEQEQPVHRRVALKIIKLGMDTKQVIARFEAERQALALMNHPNVARVFDGGTTPTGRPYFVMEYVQGVPITDYCDRHKLSTQERLELFIPVCEAVQHAHQKGIIHRDIKPSNVLVALIDDKPIPKVIDFGVAKATNQRLTERTVYTEQGQLIGTPEYMSPEQAEMNQLDIDTRTDIYSLGVLLYELLTGTVPFDARKLRRAGFAEIQRIIREVEPAKPSTRMISLEKEPSAPGAGALEEPGNRPSSIALTAEKRRTDPRALIKLLRGDLDWVTMKALEKDRTRRYATATDLAADIRHHLRNEPVSAGPPSAGYRIRKFARRNRGAVVAGTIVMTTLVAATTGMSILSAKAVRERMRADQNAAEARQQAEQADAARKAASEREAETKRVADFQVEMLKGVDVEAMGRGIVREMREQVGGGLGRGSERPSSAEETTAALRAFDDSVRRGNPADVARGVMDEYVLRPASDAIEKKFTGQPLVQAQLHDAIGTTYESLGMYDAALPQFRAALAIRQRVHGEEHRDVAESLNKLGGLMYSRGEYANAEPILRQALTMQRKLFGEEALETARIMCNLGLLLHAKGEDAEAEGFSRKSLAVHRKEEGDKSADVATMLNNLGLVLQGKGDFAGAEQAFGEALALRRELHGNEHRDVAVVLQNLAGLYYVKGEFDRAEPLLRQCLAIWRKLLGDEHPDVLSGMNSLGMTLLAMGDIAGAELIMRQTLERLRQALGDEHPDVAGNKNNLAWLLQCSGRYAEAEPLHREALAVWRARLGNEHENTLTALSNLGGVLLLQGRLEEAEPLCRQAVDISRRTRGEQSSMTASLIRRMGRLKLSQGMPAEATKYYGEARTKYEKLGQPFRRDAADCQAGIGMALCDESRYEEAEKELLAAEAIIAGATRVRMEMYPRCVEAIVKMYDRRDASEPEQGFDVRAAEWREKLRRWQASTQPASRPASN